MLPVNCQSSKWKEDLGSRQAVDSAHSDIFTVIKQAGDLLHR